MLLFLNRKALTSSSWRHLNPATSLCVVCGKVDIRISLLSLCLVVLLIAFAYTAGSISIPDAALTVDKAEYVLGEDVLITLDAPDNATSDLTLTTPSGESLLLLDDKPGSYSTLYTPDELGPYTAVCDFSDLSTTLEAGFTVIGSDGVEEESERVPSETNGERVPSTNKGSERVPSQDDFDESLPASPQQSTPSKKAKDTGSKDHMIRDANGFGVPASVEFVNKGKKFKLSTNQVDEIPAGTFDVIIRPQDHPVEEIILDNLDIPAGTTQILDLDDVPEDAGSVPGAKFKELYAINPLIELSGTVKVMAKAPHIYKCRDWDFANQVCLGEWVHLMDVVPGEYYYLDLDSADPCWGEAGTYFTLKSIVIDGDFTDWDIVLDNPHNYVTDGFGAADPDDPGTTWRDAIKFAFTWNETYFFSYFRRYSGGKNSLDYWIYFDRDNDGYMNATDKIFRCTYSGLNPNTWNSEIYDYVPDGGTPDPLTGDVEGDMPGGKTNKTTLETGIYGGNPETGLETECRVTWTVLGVPPGTPMGMHISTSNGQNIPGSVEDNLGPINSSAVEVLIVPSQTKAGSNGQTVSFNHTVTNLGNNPDVIDITNVSAEGFNIRVYWDNGTELTDTDGDSIPDVGELGCGGTANITVNVTIAGASQGTIDEVTITATSSVRSSVSDSVKDYIYVGTIVIYPSQQKRITNGSAVYYEHNVTQYTGGFQVVNINATSNNSYTVKVFNVSNGALLSDTNGDGLVDVGNISSGQEVEILVKVYIPAGAPIGSIDMTTVNASLASAPGTWAAAVDTSTVAEALTIEPNRTAYASVEGFVFYRHKVTNSQNISDVADLSNSSSRWGWPVTFYADDKETHLTDTDADGCVDTGTLAPFGGFRYIQVKVNVPVGTLVNTTELTNITANSSNQPNVFIDYVTDNTTAKLVLTFNASGRTPAVQDNYFYDYEVVYAKGTGLEPNDDVYFVWIAANGSIVYTSPDVTVDTQGHALDEYDLNYTASHGMWELVLHDASDDSILDVHIFYVSGVPPVVTWTWGDINTTVLVNHTNVTVRTNEDVSYCNLSIDGTYYPMIQNTSTTYYYEWSSIADGNYTLVVNCTDPSNLTGNSTYSWLYVDTQDPRVDWNSTVNTTLSTNTTTVAINASEDVNCTLYVNGTAYANSTIATYISWNLANYPNGNYTINASCEDRAGKKVNTTTAWLKIYYSADTTPPIIAWDWTDINSTIYVDYTKVGITSNEPVNCTLHFNGTDTPNITIGTSIKWDVTALAQGNYSSVNVTCEDAAGNNANTTTAWLDVQTCILHIENITLNPDMNIAYFNDYNYTVGIYNVSSVDYVNLTYLPLNAEGGDCYEFYVNGSCAGDEATTVAMSYLRDLTWYKPHIRPDHIYPQIEFEDDSVYWYNARNYTDLYAKNYHIFNFTNNYTINRNTSFWIEFDAAYNTATTRQLRVYLFDNTTTLAEFQSNWLNSAKGELVAVVNPGQPKHHVHTDNSSHYLIQLTSNEDGTIGVNHIGVNGHFWVVLYTAGTNGARVWNMSYRDDDLCTTQNWWVGDQGGWSTVQKTDGCPDAHVHVARYNISGSSDGVNATVCAKLSCGTESCNSTFDYFGELPNLPPVPNAITNPVFNGTYRCPINITWNRFLDPNNDTVTYNVTLLNPDGTFNMTIVGATTDNWYYWTCPGVPDGDYRLKVNGSDPGGLWSYTRLLNFSIDNTAVSVDWNSTVNTSLRTNTTQVAVNTSELANCTLFVDGAAYPNNTVATYITWDLIDYPDGNYTINVTCDDQAGNNGNSTTAWLEIDVWCTVIGNITDFYDGLVVSNTRISYESTGALVDSDNEEYYMTVLCGYNYTFEVHPLLGNFTYLSVNNLSVETDIIEVVDLEEMPRDIEEHPEIFDLWTEVVAWDPNPTNDSFNYSSITLNFTYDGSNLAAYKCANWNYTARNCTDDNWTFIEDVVDGRNNYTRTFLPGDPAMGVGSKPNVTVWMKVYDVTGLDENGRKTAGSLIGTFYNGSQVNFTQWDSYRIEIYLNNTVAGTNGIIRDPYHDNIPNELGIDLLGPDAPNATVAAGAVTINTFTPVTSAGTELGTRNLTWDAAHPHKLIENLTSVDLVYLWYVVDFNSTASSLNNATFFGEVQGSPDATLIVVFNTTADATAPAVDWNWTDINSTTAVNTSIICVNASEVVNCTLSLNSTTLVNTSQATNICWYPELADGNYTVNATCDDLAGNNVNTTDAWWDIDTTPPSVDWNSTVNTTLTTNTTTIAVNASEDVNCTLYVNGTAYVNTTVASYISWNLTNYPDGNYTINVTCDDQAGNNANTTTAWLDIDTQQLVVSWSNWNGLNSTTNYNSTSVNWTTNKVAVECNLSVDGVVSTNVTPGTYFSSFQELADGNHSLYVNCSDGVYFANTTRAWLDVDTTYPTIAWNWTDINSTITVDHTTIGINASENVNCTLHFNGTDYVNSTVGTSLTWYLSGLNEGNYSSVNVTCDDEAGNNANTTNAWLDVDTIAPSIDWNSTVNTTLTTNTTTVAVNASEDVNCTLYVNGTAYANSTVASYISWNLTNYPDGNYTINVTCDDQAGNNGNSTTSWLDIDTQFLIVTWSNWDGRNASTNYNTTSVNWTTNKVAVECNLSVDGVVYSNTTAGTTFSSFQELADGNYSLYVNCSDGIYFDNSTVAWWYIDTTYPTINWNWADINSTITVDYTTVGITSNEPVNCTLHFNGTDYANSTVGTSITWYLSGLNEGNYSSVNVTCEDIADNNVDTTNAWLDVDITPPSVDWNSTVNVTIGTNTTTVVVNASEDVNCTLYVNGTAYANSTVASYISWNLSNYPDGNYTINVTCDDQAGNNGNTTTAWLDIDTAPVLVTWGSWNGLNSTTNYNSTSVNWTTNKVAVECNLSVDGVVSTNVTPGTYFSSFQELADGNHSLYVNCTDAVGNFGNSTVAWWDIDTTYPSVDWNWTDINSTIGIDYTTVGINASEDVNCTLHFNGTDYVNSTVGTSLTWYLSGLNEGNYSSVNVTCDDQTGNNADTTNAWLNVDTTGPMIWWTWSDINSTINIDNTNVTVAADEDLLACTLEINSTNYTMTLNTTTTFYYELSGIADGNYTLQAFCNDTVNNSASTTVAWVNIDTTAPSVDWNSTVNTTITTNTTTVAVNTTEPVNCTLFVNGTAYANSTVASYISWNLTNYPDGNYTINVTCEDPAGNEGNSTTSWIKIDTEQLVVSWSTWPELNSTTNYNSTSVNWTTNKVAVECNLSVDGVVSTNVTPGIYFSSFQELADGNHSLYVNCSDASGYFDNITIAWWDIDTTPPSVDWNSTVNVTIGTNTTTVSVNASEDVNCTLYVNGTAYANTTVGTQISWNLSNYYDGNYTINVTCDDQAGNNANTTTSWLDIDGAPLFIYWSNWDGLNASTNYNTTSVNWTTSKQAIECNITYNPTYTNTTPGTYFSQNLTNLEDGNYTLYVNCSSGAQFANSTFAWWNIDTTPPSIDWNTTINTTIYTNTTTVAVNASEPVNCTLFVNGTAYANSTVGMYITWNLSNYEDGNWTINVTCEDAVNNTANTTTGWLDIDTEPIMVTWGNWTGINSTTTFDSTTVNWTTDKIALECNLSVNGTVYTIAGPGIGFAQALASLADGNWSLYVNCSDEAGNIGNTTRAWWNISAAAPPPPPGCGDGVCGEGEGCGNCPEDCGKCKEGRKVEGFIFPDGREPEPIVPVEVEPIVDIEIETDKPVFDIEEQITGVVTVTYSGGRNMDAVVTITLEGFDTLEFPVTLLAPQSELTLTFAFDIPGVADYDIVAILEGVEGIQGRTRASAGIQTRAPKAEEQPPEAVPAPVAAAPCLILGIPCLVVILLLIALALFILFLWKRRKRRMNKRGALLAMLSPDGGQDLKDYYELYSEELGIDLASRKEEEIFKWFIASLLFGARISEEIAEKTYKEFEKRGILSPHAILEAGHERLVEALDEGGYARYDESTAKKLVDIVKTLQGEYGTLGELHEAAASPRDLERKLRRFKGIGPVTANIFLREMRTIWEKANPEPSSRAKKMARFLKINLKKKDRKSELFMRLEAALIRISKEPV